MGARQPPAEQRHQVERRVVGPVEVVDHEHRAAGERVERGGEDVLACAGRLERGEERAARVARDVAQRAHRARRDQRVAGAPQDARARQRRADLADQRRLADARLACDHHHAPHGGRLAERGLDRPALFLTLQEIHDARA
jgi:hypothetical protein